VSPSTQLKHLIYYIDMTMDVKNGASIQELIDNSLVVEFENRCCGNDIKCLSQMNSLPEYALLFY
jgi:hypothetical protein